MLHPQCSGVGLDCSFYRDGGLASKLIHAKLVQDTDSYVGRALPCRDAPPIWGLLPQ